ncbi:unnamed protein product [Effrenium voratum]|nr:unnamed protein product [Effrenium voratum]
MALSLLPTQAELANLGTVEAVRNWSGCNPDVWNRASEYLGNVPNLRVLAMAPMDVYKRMLEGVRIPVARPAGAAADPPPRELTAVEVIQMAVMWRVARLAFQLPDLDLLAPPQPVGAAVAAPAAGISQPKKKVKLSSHLDQMDDNEVDLMNRADLEQCYRNFREITGSDPQPEADPTMEQVTGMVAKVVEREESPYADFSVLTPYGKEMQKQMKTRSWLLQEDGTWKGVDVPGPPNYSSWLKCWRVYRTVLLMLKHKPAGTDLPLPVVNIAALEEYSDKIAELQAEFPECWHLVWQAEDKCRRDDFERIRRSLTRARVEGRLPMNLTFKPEQPWVGVFTYAARDGEYWAKNVIRPAQTFLARGGAGRKMPKEVAEAVSVDKEVLRNAQAEPGQGKSRNARKRRLEKGHKDEVDAKGNQCYFQSGSFAGSGGGGAQSGKGKSKSFVHPRKFGQYFITTREGEEEEELVTVVDDEVLTGYELHDVNSTIAQRREQHGVSSRSELARKFVFVEFFAGVGGLSVAMLDQGEGLISLGSPGRLDAYQEEWNILGEEDFAEAERLCGEADHGHFAPPCRTLTEARRSDEHGAAREMRTHQHPEGWGDPEVEEANKVVEKMVALCMILHLRGRTFAIENPFGSFLWLLKVMQRLMRLPSAELIMLHQCCYGAPTPKPTGILTTAPWMKMVKSLCFEVRGHRHLRGGLVGRVWSYLDECMVWRSSLAAEYPCGLCVAWTRALVTWLKSDEGRVWLDQRSMKRVGRWGNVLVRVDQLEKAEVRTKTFSRRDLREEENASAIGGLRHARKASQRSAALRHVGAAIRKVMDEQRDDEVLEVWERDVQAGLPDWWVNKVRKELGKTFNSSVKEGPGLQVHLWQSLLEQAEDCERKYLPEWISNGFPLGIKNEITASGAFPLTEEDTAAVEASRLEGRMMDDMDGAHGNYVSFTEAGEKAQNILDDMVALQRAEEFCSWSEVVKSFGEEARLTKMACIVKQKPSGGEKVRLVVDTRRSGVNGMMKVRERVVLPRITDVAAAWENLLRLNCEGTQAELMVADFKDAFNMLGLRQNERPFVIVKGLNAANGAPRYFAFSVVVFGLAPGPLLWGRLAAAAMRLGQASMRPNEGEVCTFVDDPIVVAAGLGGFISVAGEVVAYWHDTVSQEDVSMIGVTIGVMFEMDASRSDESLVAVFGSVFGASTGWMDAMPVDEDDQAWSIIPAEGSRAGGSGVATVTTESGEVPALPVTVESLLVNAAILREAGFRASMSYLYEAKVLTQMSAKFATMEEAWEEAERQLRQGLDLISDSVVAMPKCELWIATRGACRPIFESEEALHRALKAPERWMGVLKEEGCLPPRLADLTIIGSHDSGAYWLGDRAAHCGAKCRACELAPRTTRAWGLAQRGPILQQLLDGVRYFDLRLTVDRSVEGCRHKDTVTAECWKAQHCLLGPPAANLTRDVRSFLLMDKNQSEVVILNLKLEFFTSTGWQGQGPELTRARLEVLRQLLVADLGDFMSEEEGWWLQPLQRLKRRLVVLIQGRHLAVWLQEPGARSRFDAMLGDPGRVAGVSIG